MVACGGPCRIVSHPQTEADEGKREYPYCVKGKGREAIPSHSSCCRAYYGTPSTAICSSPISIYRHQPCKWGASFFVCFHVHAHASVCIFSLAAIVQLVQWKGETEGDRGRIGKEILDLQYTVVHIHIIIPGDNLMHTTFLPPLPLQKNPPTQVAPTVSHQWSSCPAPNFSPSAPGLLSARANKSTDWTD